MQNKTYFDLIHGFYQLFHMSLNDLRDIEDIMTRLKHAIILAHYEIYFHYEQGNEVGNFILIIEKLKLNFLYLKKISSKDLEEYTHRKSVVSEEMLKMVMTDHEIEDLKKNIQNLELKLNEKDLYIIENELD